MMFSIRRFLRRLPVILAGYVIASFIGGFVLLLKELVDSLFSYGRLEIMHGEIAVSDFLFFAVMAVGIYSAIPAMAVIVFAELKRRTHWLFYVISAAAIPVLVLVFLFLISPSTSEGSLFQVSLLFELVILYIPTSAFCGFVFWRIAGRTAGAWRTLTVLPSAGS